MRSGAPTQEALGAVQEPSRHCRGDDRCPRGVPGAGKKRDAVEKEAQRSPSRHVSSRPPGRAATTAGMDRMDNLLWGLRMVRSDLARAVQPGKKGVRVGVLDSGIDSRHPDIAPNFDAATSSLTWPTSTGHVSSLAAKTPQLGRLGPRNPRRRHHRGRCQRLGDLRCRTQCDPGQHQGWPGPRLRLPRSRVNALTYGGDIDLDVINMSFMSTRGSTTA